MTRMIEQGENNWHAAVKDVSGFSPPFQFWKLLATLQERLSLPPWRLDCEQHNASSKTSDDRPTFFCPACVMAKENQVEWYYESAQVDMVFTEPSHPTPFTVTKSKHQREAWVTLLTASEDDLETYVAAVRTLAYSVQKTEEKSEKRDFIVLTQAPKWAQEFLRADGLVVVEAGTDDLAQNITFPSGKPPRGSAKWEATISGWWQKVHLWTLPYDKIVFLDADIIVTHSIEPLFDVDADFAVPVENDVVLGLMVIKPSKAIFDAVIDALRSCSTEWNDVTMRQLDQSWWHGFWYHRGLQDVREVRWYSDGAFMDCDGDKPPLIKPIVQDELAEDTWKVCAIPFDFHVPVTYPQLMLLKSKTDLSLLEKARLLHWPGPRRKPWQHWSPLAETKYDRLWWNMYGEMCAQWGCTTKLQCE
eukprot:GEMP01025034.1.p1 GENE.GEMP01025034.1~~GEMP01025034.1.p1  ORF type:complete len:417 (+),score=109.55 GEMP01025034.1:1034-2284(+)